MLNSKSVNYIASSPFLPLLLLSTTPQSTFRPPTPPSQSNLTNKTSWIPNLIPNTLLLPRCAQARSKKHCGYFLTELFWVKLVRKGAELRQELWNRSTLGASLLWEIITRSESCWVRWEAHWIMYKSASQRKLLHLHLPFFPPLLWFPSCPRSASSPLPS